MEIYVRSSKYSSNIIKARLKGKRLLDIGGAAFCHRVNFLSEFVDEAVMLDLEQPSLPLEKHVKALTMDANDISPETVGIFDEIVMSNVLEHMDEPLNILKKAAAVLSQQGRIHILSPNCESLNRRIGLEMGILKDIREIPEKEKLIGHKQAFSVKDIFSMASAAGLSVDECVGVLLKPVPTSEMIKWTEERFQAFLSIAKSMPPELCHEVYFCCSLR